MANAAELRETRFDNQRLAAIGVELLRLSELFARVPEAHLRAPERVAFGLVIVVASGRGEHLVDFNHVYLEPGSVVVVPPGAVQQWRPAVGLEGDVLLIEPQLIRPVHTGPAGQASGLLRFEEWPACFSLQGRGQLQWQALCELLRSELAQPGLDELSAATARELQQCLLLVLARGAQQAAPSATVHDTLCRQMAKVLDHLVATRPTVQTLARRLRTSPSTLNRACQGMLGLSAKAVIDRRVALEAKRLLVHTEATAAALSEQLGFSEPTNFLKFFKRCLGLTPDQFRQAQRSQAPQGEPERPVTSPTRSSPGAHRAGAPAASETAARPR